MRGLFLATLLFAGTAQGQMLQAIVAATGAAPYQGPGDVAGITYVEAYSCSQALTAATKGNKLCNICLTSAPTSCVDASSSASTGLVVNPSPGGTACGATGGANQCEVKTAYSLTGTGHDLTQATSAVRPLFIPPGQSGSVNGVGTLYCGANDTTENLTRLVAGSTGTTGTPFSVITATAQGFNDTVLPIFASNTGGVQVLWGASIGNVNFLSNGEAIASGYTFGNFISIVGTDNATNTTVSINGATPASVAGGANNITGTAALCSDNAGNFSTGPIGFLGWTASATSSQVAITANFHTVWNN